MKLYYAPGACSLVVRIILNELNLDFKDEQVDLKLKKTASGDDYLSINPKGAVPALLLDEGSLLTENQVILQYLADNYSKHSLLAPLGDIKRYQVLERLNYISTELHKSLGLMFNPNLSEEAKTKTIIPLIMARFAFINEHLGKGPYLFGESFNLPDAYLFVMLRWASYFKIDLSAYKSIETFKQAMEKRPSVVKALKQEGL